MQAASLAVFLILYWCFRFQLSHRRYLFDSGHSDVYQSKKFRIYFIGISPTRSVVRIYLVGFILTTPSPPEDRRATRCWALIAKSCHQDYPVLRWVGQQNRTVRDGTIGIGQPARSGCFHRNDSYAARGCVSISMGAHVPYLSGGD